jgi:hypothetical protein
MMIPSDAQLDQLEAIVTQYGSGELSVDEAARQIFEIGFTDGFGVGADSEETFESPEFQPFRDLLDAVLRRQDLHRPA